MGIGYKITCKKCRGTSKVKIIDDEHIQYIDTTPIISARKRKDLQWGFECLCGNDTRMCKQEFPEATNLLKGSSGSVITRVIDNMRQSNEDNFIMSKM